MIGNERALEAQVCAVAKRFGINGDLVKVKEVSGGIINSTYKAFFIIDGKEKIYIVQTINSFVFKSPQKIMCNIKKISEHLKAKGGKYLVFLEDENCEYFTVDEHGTVWRIYEYIDGISYEYTDDLDMIRGAGRALGEFHCMLSDLNAEELYYTIPDFHYTTKRLEKLYSDIEKDEYGRVSEVLSEIEVIRSFAEKASILSHMYENGEIPLRATHNDTKIPNVLFEKDSTKSILLIDLDTVMPGLSVHDFGDAVRYAASSSKEDEEDLSKVYFDLARLSAFAEGYIPCVKNALTKTELDCMALGAFTITLEQSVRFLDDYICGDKYFKINSEKHNLVRARCQLKLAVDIDVKFKEMREIISRINELN